MPGFKPIFFKHHLSFERVAHFLKGESLLYGKSFANVCDNIRKVSQTLYYGFRKSKVFSPIFKQSDINILKDLKSKSDIIICRPDKGRGVVLLNKVDYINKMNNILLDTSKFRKLSDASVFRQSLKHEDKVNRVLRRLYDKDVFTKEQYNNLHSSGSGPGILYGLPKIHKLSVPLRPIIAAYNTPAFNLAKFLVPILQEFTINEYTIKNSYTFYDDVTKLHLPDNAFLASFDVVSLFTNIPVDETIGIICDKMFCNQQTFRGMTKPEFKSLISLAVKESFFLFDKIPYMQVDGVSMGSPLAPTLANIFLCHHEQLWMDNCPPEFKPLYFRRYVDDTFLVFNKVDQASLFLQYLNNQHPNIEFTMDGAIDGSLSFLDLNISQDTGKLSTQIFRKPTFSGLGISFFSHVPLNFKVNAITTLLHRAYNLSSAFSSFSIELDFLRNFFSNNGYPAHLFENQCKKFLNYIYHPKPVSFDVLRRNVYFSVPYYGRESEKQYSSLSESLSDFYPQFKFKFVPTNPFTIGSLFPYKDRLPDELRSNIVYKYSCECCNASYIGSTHQGMSVRIGQHRGISHRTDRPLSTVMHSLPRNHAEEYNHPINTNNFTIINSSSNSGDLFILESLHIQRDKPNLINIRQSAAPLFIAN
jgi:hypothetical protein